MITVLRTKPSFHNSSGTRQLALDFGRHAAAADRPASRSRILASPIARSPQCAVTASANSRSWICFSSRRGAAVLAGDLVDIDDLGLDPAGMRRQQQDAVADLDRLRDRMGDEQHGEFRLRPRAAAARPAGAPRQRVERGERLVHQQDIRLHRHAARDRDALLHAAGQRVRIGVDDAGEADLLDIGARPRLGFLARQPARHQQRKHHVFQHRLPRQQLVELLEHHHAVGAGLGDLAAR